MKLERDKLIPARVVWVPTHSFIYQCYTVLSLAYARKRGLGPYREPATRREARDKDLASLGRRGFGYDLARRVIDADDPEALAAEAD